MTKELSRINDLIFKKLGLNILNIVTDSECEEYYGLNFQIHTQNIKFRRAKITPKKIGQFVTLWKRNFNGQTEPFNVNDDFNFYIIAVEEQENYIGFFIFPQQVLNEKQILTSKNRDGKRGFRVYANWNVPENKQAERTKSWQTNYFIDLTNEEAISIEKFKTIFYQ